MLARDRRRRAERRTADHARIADVLERKRQLFNELIEHNGSPPQMGLTEAEIFGLFNLRTPKGAIKPAA